MGRPSVVDTAAPYSNTKLQVRKLRVLLTNLPSLTDPASALLKRALPARTHRLSEGEILQVIEGYRAGSTIYELGAKHGVHRGTVSEILKRNGVPMRMQGLRAEQVDEAVRLYADGWTQEQIGERFGVDLMTVRRRLRERGVVMRPPGRRRENTEDLPPKLQ